MAAVMIQSQIDSELKSKAEQYLKSWGLDVSTAIKIFLTKVVETHSIPFIIDSENNDNFYNTQNENWINQSREQAEQGKFVFKTADELDKMII